MVVVASFPSFTDVHRGWGAGIVVGPRALVMFSCFAALICAVLLTGVSLSFLGSFTTYKVVLWLDASPTFWEMHLIAIVGRGARILRLAHKAIRVANHSVVAASCLAVSCFLYALTWALCCRGRVGAGMDEFDSFLGKEVVLLP